MQPCSQSANAACIIVLRSPSLCVVELQLRKCPCFSQSCVDEGRQANVIVYALISCPRASGKLSFVTMFKSLAMTPV